ncbi:unnamed protein product [Sordaria macrospora k-hell]|uniref:WGS project CABT00000000 data, contig 2.502 n=1 Tax=Sordaria macrospora (strain ATCC MYA-333 / DSM 997 / K(L3346) / K-hell) TaxID=771870 RepID=F7WD00_SORMK|nr:uncharacterized protein SMAC_10735 [Sordaria macrospora k-hell]CCC05762.1 unnamed protein product [Sordaria macrospora k-hell]
MIANRSRIWSTGTVGKPITAGSCGRTFAPAGIVPTVSIPAPAPIRTVCPMATQPEDPCRRQLCAAMDRVIAAPAPDLEALAVKIDFMRERECYADDWLEIFAADACRLRAEGR